MPFGDMLTVNDRYWADLTPADLEMMVAAGEDILECYRVLTKVGGNVVGEILRHEGTFYEWDHYPTGDVYDKDTHAQYYYHAHRGVENEHGHFHTFLRRKGMPKGIEPAPYSGDADVPDGEDVITHFAAISMDKQGCPTHLFTTNRWVTGENWFKAEDVKAMLDYFLIDHAWPSWPANRWISAMMSLFRPQIFALLDARDLKIGDWTAMHPDVDVYEDRDLEITSITAISVDEQLARARQELAARQ